MPKPINPLLNTDGTVTARPCSTGHLTDVYGVTRKTFYSWLRPFRPELGRKASFFYTIPQVEFIFQKLGMPKNWDLKCQEPKAEESEV